MQILEAEYEIVTPMFIGGAAQHEQPELRPPSIKGALRFWWRALYWAECVQQNPGNRDAALNCLHQQETEFGAAAKEECYGQGKVAL